MILTFDTPTTTTTKKNKKRVIKHEISFFFVVFKIKVTIVTKLRKPEQKTPPKKNKATNCRVIRGLFFPEKQT